MTATIALPKVNQTASVSDFSRGKTAEIIERAQREPVFVLSRNKPTAVLIGIEEYSALQEFMEDWLDAKIAEERLDRWDGKTTISEEDVMAHLGITEADLAATPEVEIE
ncbi:type II toxin-antitoxin system Phd/YefM family antitoxin [Bifidobacterium jacchi]|uniref:Antitoxin n=1 Tax=Bifidobacterium jacchi TaxID=2490545 RepID=A0A5N5RGG2_9BIFI|nr:type II toxin-antitoxin system Phd/YefM family antitoxin [Bifidobacterium jacchi]KAB5606356.1 type II toxin-antitoxin system Phd/YefM family antitoxin [Bifidobacterium jacchi]